MKLNVKSQLFIRFARCYGDIIGTYPAGKNFLIDSLACHSFMLIACLLTRQVYEDIIKREKYSQEVRTLKANPTHDQ